MSHGIIEYSEDGLPKCEICGGFFKRVLTHVRQKHFLNEKEYKEQFGLDLYKGICSKESAEISRARVYENYDRCINKNLLQKGTKTRFNKGGPGRKADKISVQTKNRFKERLKTPAMKESMRINGIRLGKSGLGNKKKWNNGNKNDVC